MNLRGIYNALTSILIKKESTTSQGLNPPKKEKNDRGSEEKFRNLIVVGTGGGVKDTSHRKKVQEIRRLISMRLARMKRVEELMTKREGA